MGILEVKNLSVDIAGEQILKDISFEIEKGEALAVIGPNGSGKTTLLKAILGAIKWKGEIIKKSQLKIGYVPQKLDIDRNLPLTVGEFLRLGPVKNEYSLAEVMNLVALSKEILARHFAEISAGQFQRVLIASAILNKPDLLLFDEPTASVDIAGEETIYELLRRLQAKENIAIVLVSHDLSVVYRYANKVVCLNHSQVCYGAPHDVLTPDELKKLYGERTYYHH